MVAPFIEKRISMRHSCEANIALLHFAHPDWRDAVLRNYTTDGLCISAPFVLKPGSHLVVRMTADTYFMLPADANRELRSNCMMTVKWCVSDPVEGHGAYTAGFQLMSQR